MTEHRRHESAPQTVDAPSGETALKRATEELNGAKRAIETWLKAAAALEYGAALDAARLLSRSSASMALLGSMLRSAAAAAEEAALERGVHEQARLARLHYRERLEQAFAAAELPLQGGLPSYRAGDLVRVEIEFAAAPERIRATLNGKPASSAEPSRVALETRARLGELLGRPFSAGAFLSELRALAASLAVASGGWADIRKVHAVLRERMQGDGRDGNYSEAKFTTDLYRLLRGPSGASGPSNPDSGVDALELSPAPHARDGIYVPAPGGGNFIAAIRFGRRSRGSGN